MDLLIESFKQTGELYPVYLLKGDRVLVQRALTEFISREIFAGAPLTSYPDFYLREYGSLGIEEGRELSLLQARRALTGGKKIFVITCSSLTQEAQNSLLKTLEEPTAETHFFIVVEGQGTLLPTLLSRVRVIETGLWADPLAHQFSQSVTEFLQAKATRRLAIVESLLDEEEGAARRIKLETWLALLEREFAESLTAEGGELIAAARKWLSIPGSIPRLILEELALALPVLYNQSK